MFKLNDDTFLDSNATTQQLSATRHNRPHHTSHMPVESQHEIPTSKKIRDARWKWMVLPFLREMIVIVLFLGFWTIRNTSSRVSSWFLCSIKIAWAECSGIGKYEKFNCRGFVYCMVPWGHSLRLRISIRCGWYIVIRLYWYFRCIKRVYRNQRSIASRMWCLNVFCGKWKCCFCQRVNSWCESLFVFVQSALLCLLSNQVVCFIIKASTNDILVQRHNLKVFVDEVKQFQLK